MDYSRLEELLEKWLGKTISNDEETELLQFFSRKESEEQRAWFAEAIYRKSGASDLLPAEDAERIFKEMLHRESPFPPLHRDETRQAAPPPALPVAVRRVYRVHLLRTSWLRYAAAIVILAGSVAYLWTTNKKPEQAQAGRLSQADIAPGSNKAVLTLADGSAIILNDAKNGMLAQQGNAAVVKLGNGQIVYTAGNGKASEGMMNTMSTPRGGQYQLTLPDGTRVWLNAASSITYPTVFTGKERRVTLTGEAYFEVAPNRHQPFFAQTRRGEVAVLGTKFNVNEYDDENASKITLLQGSVRLSRKPAEAGTENNRDGVVLSPGQQATLSYDKGSSIAVTQNADIEKALAWKNGLFDFQNMRLQEVMRELARWYDLDVQYEKGVPDVRFEGGISRSVSLSDVLKGLGNMGIHFKIEGERKLIVMP